MKIDTAKILIIMLALIVLTSSAIAVETTSYSIDSLHSGITGGNATTTSQNVQTTGTYQQGSNIQVSTTSYTANSGWYTISTDITGPDLIAPNVDINNINNNQNITSSSRKTVFNITVDEPVTITYQLNGENYTVCSSCTSAYFNITLPDFGNNTVTIYVVDSGGNIDSETVTFNLVKDTDNDGTPDYLEVGGDSDGDGLNDSIDTLKGDESNVATNLEDLNITIGTTDPDNLSQAFSSTETVQIFNSTEIVTEFTFDFSSNTLDLSDLVIETQEAGSNKGSVVISGLDLSSQTGRKTVYLDRLDNNDSVCIRDEEVAVISQISDGCNNTNEYYVKCPGSKTGLGTTYTCSLINSDTKFKVTGLKYSAIQQRCTESWSCTAWTTCSSSTQNRICTDVNNCNTINDKPATTQSCTVSRSSGSSGGTLVSSAFNNVESGSLIVIEGGIYIFEHLEETHRILIHYVDEDSVTMTIQSLPITTEIRVDETKTFDINDDGFDDLSITVNSAYINRAEITLNKLYQPSDNENVIIHEPIEITLEDVDKEIIEDKAPTLEQPMLTSAPEPTLISETPYNDKKSPDKTKEKFSTGILIIWIIAFIIGIGILIFIRIQRNKELSKKKKNKSKKNKQKNKKKSKVKKK